MPFLRLNGITVPVQEGKFQKAVDVLGARDRSINGRMRQTSVANKRKYSGTLAPLDVAEAEAWKLLFLGEADYLSWDETLYSARGVAPNAGHTATIVGSGQFLNAVATGGSALTYQFGLALANFSTVSLWRWDGISAFEHYVVRSNGAKWVNGVRNDAAPTPWLALTTFSVTIASGQIVDDLFFLPFFMPDSWPPEIYDWGVSFSQPQSFPELQAAGDAIEGESHGPRLVVPAYTGADVFRAKGVGNFKETVSFELEES